MLKQDCHISKGIKGIDPDGTDKERADDEAAWFKAHPVITAELREKSRAMMLKKRGIFFEVRILWRTNYNLKREYIIKPEDINRTLPNEVYIVDSINREIAHTYLV
jgi:hypothetical protein